MRNKLYEPYRALQNHGVEVSKTRTPAMNAGGKSETSKHFAGKCLVAFAAAQTHGYMTDFEVETGNGDEIDVLLWGLSDRMTYAVELETSPTEDVKAEKLDKYVKQIPAIDDMILLNVGTMPLEIPEAVEWARDNL